MVAVIDIFLIALFILFIFLGVRNGFVRSALGMVAVAVAAISAVWLSGPVAQAVYDGFFKASIETAIAAQLPDISSAQSTVDNTQTIIASIPEAFVNAASSIGIDVSAIAEQAGSFDFSAANVAAEITESVAQPVAVALLKIVSFVLIFLIIDVVLQFVVSGISKFFKLPVLKTFNRFLGGAVGAVKGVFFVVTLALLLNASAAVISNVDFVGAVNSSKIINIIVSTDVFSQLALS